MVGVEMTNQTQTPPRGSILDRISDFWAYVIPMAIFMALTWLGTQSKQWYPACYVAKTVLAALALYILWPKFTPVRWNHWWLGIIVGVVGTVQWIGMEKLLMSQPWLFWTRMISDVQAKAYVPHEQIESAGLMWSFILIRWAGASLVVPVMEELFWRDLLWRNIIAPNDFKLAQVGEYDRNAFWIVPAIFAAVHVQWLTAIVWGLLIALLLVRTRSLGACMIAHGVTNFLLGAYVLYTREWFFW
jgi:CAAX prenyl protease-like protein